jgi:hypothetical protein
MIQIIRNGGVVGFILGLFVIILSKCAFELVPDFPQVTYTPLLSSIKDLTTGTPYLDIILGISFILLQASLFTYILNQHKVIKEQSFFPFILYIMLAGVYNEQFYLNPASFLNFFLILIIERMLRLQDTGKNPGVLFLDIGTLVGLSLLFSKEALFYIPFIFLGVVLIYAYNFNSILIMALSVMVVMIIAAGIYFLTGNFNKFHLFFSFTPIILGINFSHWQERFFLLLILFVLLSVISFFHFQFTSTKISNKSRRFAGVFILLWIVGFLVLMFQELNLWFNTALLVIPMALFGSNFLQDDKGKDWFKNLIFIILIIGLISVQLNY